MIFIYYVAPDPVTALDFTIISNISGVISWNEPEQPNGVIVEYVIILKGNGEFIDSFVISSTESALQLRNLGMFYHAPISLILLSPTATPR